MLGTNGTAWRPLYEAGYPPIEPPGADFLSWMHAECAPASYGVTTSGETTDAVQGTVRVALPPGANAHLTAALNHALGGQGDGAPGPGVLTYGVDHPEVRAQAAVRAAQLVRAWLAWQKYPDDPALHFFFDQFVKSGDVSPDAPGAGHTVGTTFRPESIEAPPADFVAAVEQAQAQAPGYVWETTPPAFVVSTVRPTDPRQPFVYVAADGALHVYARTRATQVRERLDAPLRIEESAAVALSTATEARHAPDDDPLRPLAKAYTQYVHHGNVFKPSGPGVFTEHLGRSAYRVMPTMTGIEFHRTRAQTDQLFRFPNSVMEHVLVEIDKFWNLAEDYAKFGIRHTRGILLEGGPGNGKSCLIQQVVEMMVQRGDVVFFARTIGAVKEGLKAFREVEATRPVVVVLEDADEFLKYDQREFLQLMDGDDSIPGVLYLATTNYLSQFPERLRRPGRFDKIVHVPPPPLEGRQAYLEHKLRDVEKAPEIQRLALATEGMSFGHLREFVIAVYLLKEAKADTLRRLRAQTGIPDPGVHESVTEAVVVEVSPPGFSGTVASMKAHPEIENPYALAWTMYRKGAKPGKPPEQGKPGYVTPATHAARQARKAAARPRRALAASVDGSDTLSLGEGTDMTIANEILRQLGGRRFVMMTGAKHLIGDTRSLSFQIGRNKSAANGVRITLTPADTYEVEFVSTRGQRKVLKTFTDIYADDLQRIFTDYTGLVTSLGTMGRSESVLDTLVREFATVQPFPTDRRGFLTDCLEALGRGTTLRSPYFPAVAERAQAQRLFDRMAPMRESLGEAFDPDASPGKTQSGKTIPAMGDVAYTKGYTFPKITGEISPVRPGPSTDKAAKALHLNLPDWTKQDHLDAARAHAEAAETADREWGRVRDAEHQRVFGTKPEFTDYKVSGIGRSEYSEKGKARLRALAGGRSRHTDLAHAHAHAARYLRPVREGVEESAAGDAALARLDADMREAVHGLGVAQKGVVAALDAAGTPLPLVDLARHAHLQGVHFAEIQDAAAALARKGVVARTQVEGTPHYALAEARDTVSETVLPEGLARAKPLKGALARAVWNRVSFTDKSINDGKHVIMLVGGPAKAFGKPNYTHVTLEDLALAEIETLARAYGVGESVTEAMFAVGAWRHAGAQDYADRLMGAFGEPNTQSADAATWTDEAGFDEITVRDEFLPHDFPAPHHDFVYASLALLVPPHLTDEFAAVSGSILIDGLKGTVTARCGSLLANAITLGFVADVLAGTAKPTKAEYAKRILGGLAPPWFTDPLREKPEHENQRPGEDYGTSEWPGAERGVTPPTAYAEVTEAVKGRAKTITIQVTVAGVKGVVNATYPVGAFAGTAAAEASLRAALDAADLGGRKARVGSAVYGPGDQEVEPGEALVLSWDFYLAPTPPPGAVPEHVAEAIRAKAKSITLTVTLPGASGPVVATYPLGAFDAPAAAEASLRNDWAFVIQKGRVTSAAYQPTAPLQVGPVQARSTIQPAEWNFFGQVRTKEKPEAPAEALEVLAMDEGRTTTPKYVVELFTASGGPVTTGAMPWNPRTDGAPTAKNLAAFAQGVSAQPGVMRAVRGHIRLNLGPQGQVVARWAAEEATTERAEVPPDVSKYAPDPEKYRAAVAKAQAAVDRDPGNPLTQAALAKAKKAAAAAAFLRQSLAFRYVRRERGLGSEGWDHRLVFDDPGTAREAYKALQAEFGAKLSARVDKDTVWFYEGKAVAEGSTKGPYPFADKERYYRRLTMAQLEYAKRDAAKSRDAFRGAGGEPSVENWYADDVHTILKEISRRKAGGKQEPVESRDEAAEVASPTTFCG